MNDSTLSITVDGKKITARPGQTLIEACDAAGVYIPRLCYHPDLPPGGHCRLCTSKINGRYAAACTTPVVNGMVVESNTPELNDDRRLLVEMMFIEGNHFCPSCEKSGSCELQAMAYRLGMESIQLPHEWKAKSVDATHPDVYIDRNRCILCCRCVRASETVDEKNVFGLHGRGIDSRLAINHVDGLGSTNAAATDKAIEVCPVACLTLKRTGFQTPYGQRQFDHEPIGTKIEEQHKPVEKT